MPETAQDPTQDQDFLKAPPSEQHAYLMDSDPAYAKAPQNEQKAYLDHVNGTHYTETGGTNRPTAPLPANPIEAARPGGEEVHGGGGESARPARQALVKEAGSPLGVPLAAGARALEAIRNRSQEQQIKNAATGTPEPKPIPSRNPRIPDIVSDEGTKQFLAGSGADAMRAAAGMLTPTSLGIMAAAPAAPVAVGTGLLLHGGKTAIENAPEAFKGNPEAAQKALFGASEAAGGAGLAGEGVTSGAPDIKAVTNLAKRTFDSAGGLKTLGIVKPEPAEAFTRAIQPGVNIPRAQESIPIAGARLQQVKNAGLVMDEEGNPVTEFKGNKDILQGVKAAKQYVWNALEQRTGSVAKLQTDTSGAADAMERSISKRTREQYPEIADRIERRADTYRGLKSFRDIEDAIQDANNDLRNFYKRSTPTDSPVTAETAATEAEVKYLRNLLDEKVETLTGSGTKELKREYGALRDVERAAAKQYAVETRQKGATLWEGLAALRAAGDFVSGNALGAAKGMASLAVGKRMANVRSPQWNIDQAFQGPKAFKAAGEIAPPPGVRKAGAMPAAGESQASHVQPVGVTRAQAIQPRSATGEGEFRETGRNMEGVNVMPPSGRTIITPRTGVEVEPGAPQLRTGPQPPRQLTGPEMQKALPPARQIQVGPSSLEPEGAPRPPAPETPKASPTKATGSPETTAQKAVATIRKNPEFQSSKTFQPKGFGERATAESDKLADAIMAKGKDRNFAHERAEEIQGVLDRPERHDPADVEHAKILKEMWMGPERRVGARAGEAHRGSTMPPATVPKAEPFTPKSTPRSESFKTYNSLPPEHKAVVDAQAGEIPKMPQVLREARMRELEQYGGKGTMLKERLAREVQKNPPSNEPIGEEKRSSTEDAAEIKRLQAKERDLVDQSSRVRNWVRGQKLIREARAANERWTAIKRGMRPRESGED